MRLDRLSVLDAKPAAVPSGLADIYERRSVVLLSENLARELWGSSTAAVGKRIHKMTSAVPAQERKLS
jgi:hypothetical protein